MAERGRSALPCSWFSAQGAAQRRNLGGYIEHPGLYLPAKERALENIFLKNTRYMRRQAGTSGTAAKTFWLAARRAIGALEVVMVVPKVSPGALRPNRTIFSVSLPTCPRPRYPEPQGQMSYLDISPHKADIAVNS